MNRKAGLAVCLLYSICSTGAIAAAEKVVIAHSVQLSATIAPLLYGIQRGFFRDENIDLEYRMLPTHIGVKALLNDDTIIFTAPARRFAPPCADCRSAPCPTIWKD